MEKNDQAENKQKGGSFLGWLLWWQVDKVELQKQVDGYKTLKIIQSARGISLLLTIFSAVVTVAFILFFNFDSSSLFDAILLLVLGFFIYRGHKWAMIGAMLLWSFEKVITLVTQYENGSTPNPIVSLIWWATYMHAFYLAFIVERTRTRIKNAVVTNNQKPQSIPGKLDELERMAELKNKGVITEEDFNKKKKDILGL